MKGMKRVKVTFKVLYVDDNNEVQTKEYTKYDQAKAMYDKMHNSLELIRCQSSGKCGGYLLPEYINRLEYKPLLKSYIDSLE